ncbi:MAG: CBS domain-containing protein [Gammaproteobacteria bacterium]
MLRSVLAKDYMSANLVTFTPTMDVLHAIQMLVDRQISGAPVVDETGNLVGVLSQKDCLRVALDASYHGEWGGRVSELMSRNVKTVEAETSILEVAEMFMQDEYRRYPVMEDNRLIGQISRHDVLRALITLRGA